MPDYIPKGFILLARVLLDSSLWQLSPDHLRLALYLLLRARHSPKPHVLADGLKICRGEHVTSMAQLAENCAYFDNRSHKEWSRQKTSRLLEGLKTIGFLECNSDTHGTHIRICNYDLYQQFECYNSDSNETRPVIGQPTTKTRPTTKKHENQGKKENHVKPDRGRFTDVNYPPTEPLPEIEDYADIYAIADPIVAALAVTKETKPKGFMFWVRLRDAQIRAGKPEDDFDMNFFECLSEVYGETRAGEVRNPGAILTNRLKSRFGCTPEMKYGVSQ